MSIFQFPRIQGRNEEFFRAGEVPLNKGTSINILSTTQIQGTFFNFQSSQQTITHSKSTIEIIEKDVKYVQNYNKDTRTTSMTNGRCLLGLLVNLDLLYRIGTRVLRKNIDFSWNQNES